MGGNGREVLKRAEADEEEDKEEPEKDEDEDVGILFDREDDGIGFGISVVMSMEELGNLMEEREGDEAEEEEYEE